MKHLVRYPESGRAEATKWLTWCLRLDRAVTVGEQQCLLKLKPHECEGCFFNMKRDDEEERKN